ncbi:hypothetical protein GYMLUDRAFT_246312 [Collybiopsis luxurians FD-317 M1]|uniref:F-box domain-containing protein n=1 Tax=Collybiopsis luxurians FD-317 M1 TaxID=944289 RepID=A0A0D0CIZ2_9AGAR|nr:hypothetical protein GYMLUDRAFT_246312 [Collybiopsis luxurians FD-317 M1]
MSPPSTFPPEIFDNIIDELATSKNALSACSLVHSSWAPRSKTHMFRNIAYKVDSPERDQRPSGDRTAAFQQHVASNRTVASYARHLVLTLTNRENIAAEIPQASQLHDLLSLILKCSNLIIYSVNDAVLTRLLGFIRQNNRLKRISLQSVIVDPSAFDVFMTCVAIRTRELQALHLHDVWAPDWITDAWSRWRTGHAGCNPKYKSHSLTKLCISHCEDGVIPAILRAFDVQGLQRLALLSLDWDSCAAMVSATLHATLLDLTMDFSNHRPMSSNVSREDHIFYRLASIPNLQLVLKHFRDAPSVLHRLYCASSQRQPLLQKLHLHFRRYPSPTDTMVDKALAELCSIIPLRISIGFDAEEGVRAACATTVCSREQIAALFPFMNRRGSLRFQSLDDWWDDSESRKSDF